MRWKRFYPWRCSKLCDSAMTPGRGQTGEYAWGEHPRPEKPFSTPTAPKACWLIANLVPRGGLEPPRPCGLRILSPFLASKHPPAQPRTETNNSHRMNNMGWLSTSHDVAPKCIKSRYKVAPKAAPGLFRKCFRIV